MNPTQDIERNIGLFGATGIGVGAIVGGGILALAGVAFATTGPSAILAFGLNGVIAMLTALSFAEMASKFPESGGTYTYSKKVLTVEAAFTVGWVVWFASIVAAVLYAIGFGYFAVMMVGQVSRNFFGSAAPWLAHSELPKAVALLTTVVLSMRLMAQSGGGGPWVNVGKVAVFALLIIGGTWTVIHQPPTHTVTSLRPFFVAGMGGLVQAMGYTFIALQGFDLIAAVGGEVRQPAKNLPRSMILSLATALAIYLPLLFVITAAGTSPGQSIAAVAAEDPEQIVATAAQRFLGPFGYWLVIVAAILSMYSALQANLYAASRIALTMSRDRTLPSPLSRLSGRHRTPNIAVGTTGLLVVAILVALPDVSSAGAASSLIFLITFALTHWISILVRLRSDQRPPFRTPLFPVVPVTGGLACLGLAAFQGLAVPAAGAITLLWLSMGGILYLSLFAQRARIMDASRTAFDPELVTLRGRSPLVLVPIANPQNVGAMISLADALVPAHVGRVLTQTVTVAPLDWNPDKDPGPIENLDSVLREVLRVSAKLGIRVESLTTMAPTPMEEIARVARLHRCESVLLGFSQISDNQSGQELESLLGSVDANVVVLRSPPNWRLTDAQKVLVPVAGRGGHDQLRALLLGSILRNTQRDVTFLRVIPTSQTSDEVRRVKRELARLAADEVRSTCQTEVVQDDDPLTAIATRADASDLLILGVQRLGRYKKLIGSFTTQLARRTTCPLIVMSRRG